ncbi:Enoyl-CoA hydratase [Desulfuromusa kysingii]|uniref:Enoyl-CoA hydratase n=1 Tax=Desulfuromusa kysingii TaxID=37625 RepID=A0A1H4DEW0_9BACT|nr:enoyl-CoA hydratase [Desulfuromusa kysingii]SEA71157.1 Enoyl-CoA hydratase [Desulfuromusa kysingii]
MKNRTELVRTKIDRGILQITIHRPEKKNALTLAMYTALTTALDEAEMNTAIRVILLCGAEGCFTSGNDLNDFATHPPQGEESPVFHFLRAISQANKPIIAMVSGAAVGIGTTMLLHCDLVYADQTANFQLPFVPLGLCPEAASSYLLPKLVGFLRASEILLLGECINAEKAELLGLVNQVFPKDKLRQHVMDKALRLAKQPPASVRLTKSLLRESQAQQVAEVMSKEGALFLQQLAKPEAQEAIKAFTEKRPADFSRFS